MSFWIVLWKICLIGTLVAFGTMAVFVSIGGAFDIRKLLTRLRDAESGKQNDE